VLASSSYSTWTSVTPPQTPCRWVGDVNLRDDECMDRAPSPTRAHVGPSFVSFVLREPPGASGLHRPPSKSSLIRTPSACPPKRRLPNGEPPGSRASPSQHGTHATREDCPMNHLAAHLPASALTAPPHTPHVAALPLNACAHGRASRISRGAQLGTQP
jgi:hypothetical protein